MPRRRGADAASVLYALAAPLRLTVSLLDRVRYVLDESPIAVSATARRVRIVVAAGLLAYAAVLFVGGGMGLLAGLVVSIIALVVGSGKMGLFARDWAPVAVMMGIYGIAFELAAKLGMPTWYSPQIDADRVLGLGHVPSIWLQQELGAAHNQTLAVAAAVAYASHYYFPVLLGLYVWWYHRETAFFSLMYGLLTALFLATIVYVLAPTAPPWLAAERGMLPPIHDVVKMGLLDLRLDALADHKGDPNLYLTRAAFPSVHAAWPVVSLLVVMRYRVSVWARVATLAQLAIVWFAIVYAGEHYAIDVVAGTAFGAVAFVLVERFHGRLTAAALGRDAEPAPVTDEVVVVRQVLAPEQAPSAVGQAPGDGTTRG